MWFHSDTGRYVTSLTALIYWLNKYSYGAAMVGVATAKSPCGPYTYKGSWQPLGAQSRDEGLFQDGRNYTFCHPHC